MLQSDQLSVQSQVFASKVEMRMASILLLSTVLLGKLVLLVVPERNVDSARIITNANILPHWHQHENKTSFDRFWFVLTKPKPQSQTKAQTKTHSPALFLILPFHCSK